MQSCFQRYGLFTHSFGKGCQSADLTGQKFPCSDIGQLQTLRIYFLRGLTNHRFRLVEHKRVQKDQRLTEMILGAGTTNKTR